MRDYISEQWKGVLKHNGWHDFESIWQVRADWFEPPNERRGGWSGVVRVALELEDGSTVGVFLKRQENHVRRTLRHPVVGEPTLAGEIKNILKLRENQVPTLEPIYFAQRVEGGSRKAMLATIELTDFVPLGEVVRGWQTSSVPVSIKRQIIQEVARGVSRMHLAKLKHNALHPKHIFIRMSDLSVTFIDLEKMRAVLFPWRAMRRDLDSLNRRSHGWTKTDRLRFLLYYLNEDRVTPRLRRVWQYLSDKYR